MDKDKEIKRVLRQLKRKTISLHDIPEEIEEDPKIIAFERKNGLRTTKNCGYDALTKTFFVNETIKYDFEDDDLEKNHLNFDNFDDYYSYLEGNIYNHSCYRFYKFSKDLINKYHLNEDLLYKNKALINLNRNEYYIALDKDLKEFYKEGKNNKRNILKWKEKFANCEGYDSLCKVIKSFKDSKCKDMFPLSCMYQSYINARSNIDSRLSDVLQYISEDFMKADIPSLCALIYRYDLNERLRDFRFHYGSSATSQRYRKILLNLLDDMNNIHSIKKSSFFSIKTNFYISEINYSTNDRPNDYHYLCRVYFDDFEDFAKFLDYDLSDCDLSRDFDLIIDTNLFKTNENTLLPFDSLLTLKSKESIAYEDEKFIVSTEWTNKKGQVIFSNTGKMSYFFDICYFTNDDLSGVDLIRCYNLINIDDLDGVKIDNAIIPSNILNKFNINFDKQMISFDRMVPLKRTYENENNSLMIIDDGKEENYLSEVEDFDFDINTYKIGYITDLHLEYRIKNNKCKTMIDVLTLFNKIIDNLSLLPVHFLLIGGDTADHFVYVKAFVELLNSRGFSKRTIFVLGNHELWNCEGYSVDEYIKKIKDLIEENDMFLLDNDLFYVSEGYVDGKRCYKKKIINFSDLNKYSIDEINENLKLSRLVIYGGIGFASYNEEFNAESGIYNDSINREDELSRNIQFENLYDKLLPILQSKNGIVLTHMPKKDWCKNPKPDRNVIYVSGHTHTNYIYDDGTYRVYSNNQVGYNGKNVYLKYFDLCNKYDLFDSYKDGIYEISKDDYRNFNFGRNLYIECNRKTNILYMLKKHGYYAFFHENVYGQLAIFNGGALKNVINDDINYYYENMDLMIDIINEPLQKYSKYQKIISDAVKKFGGSGSIHGAIIDIDFYNHLYLNPYDSKITPYYALDMVNKTVYPSLENLLESKCPNLYENVKLLKANDSGVLIPSMNLSRIEKPTQYDSTDIYGASRLICKMQKLQNKILVAWDESLLNSYKLKINKNKKMIK